MTPPSPPISAILPAYNAESTIARALDSVLAQTYAPSEIIVVDDGSEDGTAAIVESYRSRGVELLRNSTHQGAAAARNSGIRHSRGALVAFQDADDEWLPQKLERQVPVIASASNMTLICCWAEQMVDGMPVGLVNQSRRPPTGSQAWKSLLAYPFVATPCAIARREALFAAGLFDPRLPVAEDQDLWIKLARLGEVGFLDEVLVRVHDIEGSLTKRYGVRAIEHVLNMVHGHLASATAGELSAQERREILRRRFASLGRTACELGAPGRGAGLLLRAAALGHLSVRDMMTMAKSAPPGIALKRLYEGWLRSRSDETD